MADLHRLMVDLHRRVTDAEKRLASADLVRQAAAEAKAAEVAAAKAAQAAALVVRNVCWLHLSHPYMRALRVARALSCHACRRHHHKPAQTLRRTQ